MRSVVIHMIWKCLQRSHLTLHVIYCNILMKSHHKGKVYSYLLFHSNSFHFFIVHNPLFRGYMFWFFGFLQFSLTGTRFIFEGLKPTFCTRVSLHSLSVGSGRRWQFWAVTSVVCHFCHFVGAQQGLVVILILLVGNNGESVLLKIQCALRPLSSFLKNSA